ncbi:MAG: hypothetical protein HY929_03740, partial [Euryarchaeota archaeon]|nr:hypothetical protein [Euryarchaeota archaeon]
FGCTSFIIQIFQIFQQLKTVKEMKLIDMIANIYRPYLHLMVHLLNGIQIKLISKQSVLIQELAG